MLFLMVAKNIFNLANVNTVPCMITALSLMIYSMLKMINSIKSANYQLNRFLTSSTLSAHSTPIISAESTVCLPNF